MDGKRHRWCKNKNHPVLHEAKVYTSRDQSYEKITDSLSANIQIYISKHYLLV